jgi:formate-dependent nitrite reductase membrane component NrfD
MTASSKPKDKEERLEEIRVAALQQAQGPFEKGGVPSPGGYYGLPLLKQPTWTWEVPLYFFLGGISGVSGCMAFVAQIFHADPQLVRTCLWMGLIGAAICPILLIMDLGRPERFLYMLRVFKPQSTMSMGAWILVAFSGCAFLGVLGIELVFRGLFGSVALALLWLGEGSGAVTGLLLASYTGVLVGATAIPVWSENRKLLPAHFLTSGLGSAAGILELFGFLIPATHVLGFAAAGVETLVGAWIELHQNRVNAPLHHGKSGITLRLSGVIEGPLALLLRVFAAQVPGGRRTAAIAFLVGALISRYGWIWSGRASANDPQALFELQRKTSPAQ